MRPPRVLQVYSFVNESYSKIKTIFTEKVMRTKLTEKYNFAQKMIFLKNETYQQLAKEFVLILIFFLMQNLVPFSIFVLLNGKNVFFENSKKHLFMDRKQLKLHIKCSKLAKNLHAAPLSSIFVDHSSRTPQARAYSGNYATKCHNTRNVNVFVITKITLTLPLGLIDLIILFRKKRGYIRSMP